MFVLQWQIDNMTHRFASMSAAKLARIVRDTARKAIREAIQEIEDEDEERCYAEQRSLMEQELEA